MATSTAIVPTSNAIVAAGNAAAPTSTDAPSTALVTASSSAPASSGRGTSSASASASASQNAGVDGTSGDGERSPATKAAWYACFFNLWCHILHVDRAIFVVCLTYWIAIMFLGVYTIVLDLAPKDSKLDWQMLHDMAAGALLFLMAFLGIYWDIRSCNLVILTCTEEILQFVIYVATGSFVADGPWSLTKTPTDTSEACTVLGHVLTVAGTVLAVARLGVGLIKRRNKEITRRVVPSTGTNTGDLKQQLTMKNAV